MHILLIGRTGCGASGIIRQIAEALNMPVFGYETVKEDTLAQKDRGSPIYIYEFGKPHHRNTDNLVGYCLNHHAAAFPEAFERFAPKLRQPVSKDHLIVLDEIGPMESKAPAFCDAILALLDGDVPVIAAVRDKDTDFLKTLRCHQGCKCFYPTPDNRDIILSEILKSFGRDTEESK